MRFKTFLNEADSITFEDMVGQLKRDCDPWLKLADETATKFIYRGVGDHSQLVKPEKELVKYPVISSSWKDGVRRPRDTQVNVHEILNHYLKKWFGFPYREKALFAISSQSAAEGYTFNKGTKDYGNVCLVFPIGPVKFCYSKKFSDVSWWLSGPGGFQSDWTKEHPQTDYKDFDAWYHACLEATERFVMDRKNIEYVENEDLQLAFEKRREIMIQCKNIYLLPLNDQHEFTHFPGYRPKDLIEPLFGDQWTDEAMAKRVKKNEI